MDYFIKEKEKKDMYKLWVDEKITLSEYKKYLKKNK